MADVAVTPAVHKAPAKAAVKTDLKDTITLTFAGDDKALFDKIEAAAKADKRAAGEVSPPSRLASSCAQAG